MLAEMDPQTMVDDLIGQLEDLYTQITDAKTSVGDFEQYFNLVPVAVNVFAILLIAMTSVGLVLGFLNMTSLGSCLTCCSSCLSIPCLLLS